MSDFNENFYDKIKQNFLKISKRILKQNLSTNENTLKGYETDIITSYNEISSYLNDFFEKYTEDFDKFLRSEIIYIREKTLKCFGKLNIHIKLPEDLFTAINNETLTDFSDSSDLSDNDNTFIEQKQLEQSVSQYNSNEHIFNETLNQSFGHFSQHNINNMVNDDNLRSAGGAENATRMTRLEFIRVASQTINKNYSGDPLALNAFINSITLAQQLSDGIYDEFLKTFILTKLEGKALECVDQDGTIAQIIADLRKNIKPDNSKVVSGRMLAIKLGKLSAPEFSKQAEELAESLQRSLIVEGISREKVVNLRKLMLFAQF